MMSSLIFRCYTTQDIIGVELGGALKNPLAIGAGMIEGRYCTYYSSFLFFTVLL
jgi:glycerol-3-phosphate dehydrogenase